MPRKKSHCLWDTQGLRILLLCIFILFYQSRWSLYPCPLSLSLNRILRPGKKKFQVNYRFTFLPLLVSFVPSSVPCIIIVSFSLLLSAEGNGCVSYKKPPFGYNNNNRGIGGKIFEIYYVFRLKNREMTSI